MNDEKTAVAKAFGTALREERKKQAFSQEQLALESGIDRTFISMLERGIRQPALSTVFTICEVLSLKPSKLVQRTDELLGK